MVAFEKAPDCLSVRHQIPWRRSGGCAEDADCSLVGAGYRMIHEWVVAWLANAELENCAISWPHLKTLHPVEGIGRIAAAIDGPEHRADYVKTRSPVGSRIDEENPDQPPTFIGIGWSAYLSMTPLNTTKSGRSSIMRLLSPETIPLSSGSP